MRSDTEILTMPPQAYSYLRFSSAIQARGDSRRRQEAFAATICQEEGAILDESLTLADLGVSAFRGKNAQVGALSQFLEAVQTGRVCRGSILILESIDRLSRAKVGEALQLFIRLLNAGIIIVTAEPRRKYTANSINDIASILEPLIYMSRAHEESQTKSMRLKAAWGQKKKVAAETKKPISHNCPAWIELQEDSYRLIPARAETVRRIFQLTIDGMGAFRLTRLFRAEGVPCFGHKGIWTPSYVRLIRSRPAAYGAYTPGLRDAEGKQRSTGERIPGYYPAVVSEAEWEAAQAATKARFRASGRPGTDEANLFTGIVFDARTQKVLSITCNQQQKKTYRYLQAHGDCFDSPLKSGRSIPYETFEAAIIQTLGELQARDVRENSQVADEREQQIQMLTNELIALDHRLRTLEEQAADPAQDADLLPSLLAIIANIAKQKKRKAEQLRKIKEQGTSAGRAENLGEAQSLLQLLGEAPPAEVASLRRKVKSRVKTLVECIWVLTQSIHRSTQIIHAQIYLKGGRRHYLQIRPKKSVGDTGWNLRDFDFRAGEIGDIAAHAQAEPKKIG